LETEALDAFALLLKIEPGNGLARYAWLNSLEQRQPTEATLSLLQRLVAEAPKDPELNYRLGEHLDAVGDVDSAAAAWVRVIDVDGGGWGVRASERLSEMRR
jgi:predicted TPR repeat methyltransferase